MKKILIYAVFNGSRDNLIDFSGKQYASYAYIFIGGHIEGNYSLNTIGWIRYYENNKSISYINNSNSVNQQTGQFSIYAEPSFSGNVLNFKIVTKISVAPNGTLYLI